MSSSRNGCSTDQAIGATGRTAIFTDVSRIAVPGNAQEPGNDIIHDYNELAQMLSQTRDITDEPLSVAVLELGHRTISDIDGVSFPNPSLMVFHEEHDSLRLPLSQGIPPELGNLLAEIFFVLTCTAGQIAFTLTQASIGIPQTMLQEALGISPSQTPWLLASTMLASGLSVIISGSLADLAPPKPLIVGSFLWQAIWNLVSAIAVRPTFKTLFFIARAMQGLAMGTLLSASMSVLGRVYNPGIRKTRVFSFMAAGAPIGYFIGSLQGGALSRHPSWIFGSTAIFVTICALAAYFTIPTLRPALDSSRSEEPSLRQFDYAGAFFASIGCILIIFGLTQGSSAHWNPYTYSMVVVGFLSLGGFYLVEQRVARPLIPNGVWQTPGFVALLVSYSLGIGAYSGAWQFYAIKFWQRYQGVTPLISALYFLPNAIFGVFAAWVVSRTLHVVSGHWILVASMVCFALGPVFFIPQTPNSSYWALSMPGVALATFGPDLSFAAAAIFITSSVPRSYQGSAGSLLVTVQNLAIAVTMSICESIGVKVDVLPTGEIGLDGIKAIWWFGFAAAMTGAFITGTMVRIPKAEEKEHVQ